MRNEDFAQWEQEMSQTAADVDLLALAYAVGIVKE